MEAVDEIVAEFLVESHENLDQLDTDLLALEQEPGSRELLGSVFRTIHTIKGTSGFLAFHQLEQLTHVGENLLSRLRDGKIQLTEERSTALLSMVDAVRGLLATIEQTGGEGDGDHSALTAQLGALLEDDDSAAPAAASPAAPAPGAEGAADVVPEPAPEAQSEPEPAPLIPAQATGPTPAAEKKPEAQPAPKPDAKPDAKAPAAGEEEPGEARRSVVDSSVRVDVDLLDSLMRMVGELVLARNQLVSELDDAKDTGLGRSAQRLSLVTSELQEQVMKTRMQSVDAVWSKLPRVVRDLARQCGRQVRLEMQGRDTELDRSVLEAIKDPLTHLVRNAIDHGIESPEARVAAGKGPEGQLTLRAYHEAGQVHLEIIDDGKGIDPGVIGAKALERELVTQSQLDRMTSREIIQLIFLPGFSTAGQVTNVSGRGVGMDVVKTRIEGIGGSVDVTSAVGAGSTFRLTIPLTLAIIPALTIGCHGRRYAVPQVSVLELVRLAGDHARGGIEMISGAPVYRLRGTLLPLVRLDEQLGLVPVGSHDQSHEEPLEHDEPVAADGEGEPLDAAEQLQSTEERGGYIVVLQAEQHRFGLVVDDVLDTQEIVVKPLGRHLKGLPLYAGATILGDGSVVLILDATTLARHANVLTNAANAEATDVVDGVEQIDPVLVVEVAGGRQAAIPLDMVTRLEEIPNAAVERVGGREVTQYRGHIMPVARLSNVLGAYGMGEEERDTVPLVVYTRGARSVGFAVERIVDIATERAGTRSDIDGEALLGSVVVGERVVELLDVRAAVLAADPGFYSENGGAPLTEPELLEAGAL
ncbi:chemotaxis protein CheW [Spongisporangium articulatum]|uniref:histidine kinase n=1 Tax=Spongisporangium articulatum TaxID=3362603 RepID=A0ABW8AMV5_9ACTN